MFPWGVCGEEARAVASNPWKLCLGLRLLAEMLSLLVAAVLAPGVELELPLEMNFWECSRAGTDSIIIKSINSRARL